MPRRRVSKGREGGRKPKALKRSDGKIKKWNTIEDIPMDEEDQFHNSKDKILLEGNDNGWEDDGDDDEVFALKGLEDDESDEDQQYHEDDEGEQDEEPVAPVKKKSKKSKKSKAKAGEEDDKSEEEQELEESWGKGRAAYYSSNADQLESDDEEGNELEEQEAKRLQAKMREEMKDDDFGLDDEPVVEDTAAQNEDFLDTTPSILPSLGTDKKSLLRHLEKTSPESLALARDWDDTVRNLQRTREKIEKLESSESDALSLGMVHLHYQALLSYSTTLAFYLHMRSSAKYAQRPALLQSHPILQRLLTLKQSLQTLEDLDFAASDSEEDEDEDSEFSEMDMDEMLADGEKLWGPDDDDEVIEVDSDELSELLKEAKEQEALHAPESGTSKRPKKKRKTSEAAEKTVTPVFDLVEPEFTPSKPSSSRRQPISSAADAFGEDVSLHSVDAADKSARKKSLRFHTSKIESASARRQGARNQAAGGDDDIPYRERKKDKDAKSVREAAIRAQNQFGAELDDEEPEPRAGDKRSREDDESGDSADEYYELVKKRSKEEKLKKKAQYEEEHGLDRVPLDGETSGPRSLTRAILTNKGLTPRRPKSVRNPRVKKREKYEKAKKKLSSQKAVYKGGLAESHGRYDGERSGISKVVKSIQLG